MILKKNLKILHYLIKIHY